MTVNYTGRDVSELSEESFRNRLPVVIYLLTLIVVGFFSNVIVILVYVFRSLPSATRAFVLGMAVCDLLTSVVGLPLQLATIRYAYDTYSLWFCRGMFAAATLPTQSSGVILNVVAVDRYRRICKPHKKQFNELRACKLVAASIIMTSIIFSCFIPMYGIHILEVKGVNVSMCWSYDEYKDTIYPDLYSYVVVVVFYAGISVMLVAYIQVGIRLWEQTHKRRAQRTLTRAKAVSPLSPDKKVWPAVTPASRNLRRKSTRTQATGRTTLMMTVLTVFYVINWLPHLIVRYKYSHPVNWCEQFTECGDNVYALALRSYYINSAVNAFVYSFCSRHFRQKCWEFFSCRSPQPTEPETRFRRKSPVLASSSANPLGLMLTVTSTTIASRRPTLTREQAPRRVTVTEDHAINPNSTTPSTGDSPQTH